MHEKTMVFTGHFKTSDGGYVVHITEHGEVWLNTEVEDFDGLCIGAGDSQVEAIKDALGTLDQVRRALEQATQTRGTAR